MRKRKRAPGPGQRPDRTRCEPWDYCGPPPAAVHRTELVSPDRRRVLNATLGPQPVDATTDAEPRTAPDIALEDLTVVADMLDDAHHPVLGQAELLAEIALGPDQPLDLRHVRLQRFIHILGIHAELLGIDHGEVDPLDHIKPLVIAVSHHR